MHKTPIRRPEPAISLNLMNALIAVLAIVGLVVGWSFFVKVAPWITGAIILMGFAYAVYRVREQHEDKRLYREVELDRLRTETTIVEPDYNGNYRGPAALLPAPGNMQQPVPQSITYSPSTHYSNTVKDVNGGQLPELPPPQITEVKSFRELLTAGVIHPKTVVLGQDDHGQPIYEDKLVVGQNVHTGQLLELPRPKVKHILLLGETESGKTRTFVHLHAQDLYRGARIILVDPQGNDPESLAAQLEPLSSRFLIDPAISEHEIEQASHYALTILRQRGAGKAGKDYPVLFIADETTMLLAERERNSAAAAFYETMMNYVTAGRKVRCYTGGIGHLALSENTSSAIKYSMPTVGIHRLNKKMAHLLLDQKSRGTVEEIALIDSAPQLPNGQMLFAAPAGGIQLIAVPQVGRQDIQMLADILDGRASQAAQIDFPKRLPVDFPLTSQPREMAYEVRSGSQTVVDAEANEEVEELDAPPFDIHAQLPELDPELLRLVPQARELRKIEPSRTKQAQKLFRLSTSGGKGFSAVMEKYERIESYIIQQDALVQLYERMNQEED